MVIDPLWLLRLPPMARLPGCAVTPPDGSAPPAEERAKSAATQRPVTNRRRSWRRERQDPHRRGMSSPRAARPVRLGGRRRRANDDVALRIVEVSTDRKA